jgi:hypothetical protein
MRRLASSAPAPAFDSRRFKSTSRACRRTSDIHGRIMRSAKSPRASRRARHMGRRDVARVAAAYARQRKPAPVFVLKCVTLSITRQIPAEARAISMSLEHGPSLSRRQHRDPELRLKTKRPAAAPGDCLCKTVSRLERAALVSNLRAAQTCSIGAAWCNQ